MLEALVALAFGLLIGSFLNVCIYRLPRDLSVVRPRSYCPACQKMIAWHDNVPVLSYFLLHGHCRHCQARISPRYPVVEILTGGLFFTYFLRMGPTPDAMKYYIAIKYCILGALLVGLLFSDLEERILPDEFTLGGTLAGLALALFIPVQDITAHAIFWLLNVDVGPRLQSFTEAVFGGVVPAFFLWMGGYIYEKVRKREGMGFGDVKMMLMIGAFLGLRDALLTMIVGSVAGSIVGYLYIRITRKEVSTYELPFGTFLALGAIVVTVFGPAMTAWYGSIGG
jgi:leader peptidase (prepilin peptidase) / N-methyltransferase